MNPSKVVLALASVAMTGAVLSVAFAPSAAISATPAPTSVPLTVVIPETTPSPTPSPSSSFPGRGSSGAGNSPVIQPPVGPPARNPDGSPIPPNTPVGKGGLKPGSDRAKPGAWFVVEGSGFSSGELVQIVIYSEPVVVGSFPAEADGTFSARFKMPSDLAAGDHTIEATGWVSGHTISSDVTVVTSTVSMSSTPSLWVYFVLGALVLGTIALVIAFRQSIAIALGFSKGLAESRL